MARVSEGKIGRCRRGSSTGEGIEILPMSTDLRFIWPVIVFPQIEIDSETLLPGWVRENMPSYLLPWFVFSDGL